MNNTEIVLYAGDIMTLDRHGIKKHYCVEGERFLTNCGSEGHPWADPKKALEGIDESELTMCKEFTDNIITYFVKHTPACYKIFDQKADISSELFDIADMYSYLLKEHNDLGSYYLHTDRLGSGSAVTDGSGKAVHILGYMPYGDTLLDLSKRRLRDALRVCRIHKLYLILYEFLSRLFHLDIEQNNKINGRY